MTNHNHAGHRKRIRHRVRTEGLENFQDYQVLEYALSFVIPYKDVNPLAHELINRFGSLGGVLEAHEDDLLNVPGMGEVSAQFLTSIIKIYSYYEAEKSKVIDSISTPAETVRYVRSFLQNKLLEELYVVCLSPRNKIVKVERISRGTSSEAAVNIRLITDLVSRNKVHNIIVAHNHPQGSSDPSPEDDKFTKALVTTLVINEVYLLDHIIIGENSYYSYRSSAKLDTYREEIATLINTHIRQPMARYDYEVIDDKKW